MLNCKGELTKLLSWNLWPKYLREPALVHLLGYVMTSFADEICNC